MTSQNKNSLSKSQLKEIFQKYDVNNDNKLEFSELKNLVTDVFKETRQQQTISEEDEKAISKTVNDIISKRDIDNNKTLDWEEFSSYYMGNDIIEQSKCKHLHFIFFLS
jgi:Ca2+-binding EF-hand superfamily protein